MAAYRSVWFAPRTAPAALASGAFLSMAMAGATGAEAALVVSAGATRNVTCSASVCSATAKGAVLNVAQLQTLLASSSVQVVSGSSTAACLICSPTPRRGDDAKQLAKSFGTSFDKLRMRT